jgi:iron-sulfur cluster repair protein YtfE (RIC family)
MEELENTDVEQLETADTQTAPYRSKEDDFTKLKNLLNVHTRLEEEVFYPALAEFAETSILIQTSYDEHQVVDELVSDLSGVDPISEEWLELMALLKDNLDNHIAQEEEELFQKAKTLLGETKLNELGKEMEEMLDAAGKALSAAD